MLDSEGKNTAFRKMSNSAPALSLSRNGRFYGAAICTLAFFGLLSRCTSALSVSTPPSGIRPFSVPATASRHLTSSLYAEHRNRRNSIMNSSRCFVSGTIQSCGGTQSTTGAWKSSTQLSAAAAASLSEVTTVTNGKKIKNKSTSSRHSSSKKTIRRGNNTSLADDDASLLQQHMKYNGVGNRRRHSSISRDKRRVTADSIGAWNQREEMMQHEILTRETELRLGEQILLAKELRDAMDVLLQKKYDRTVEVGSRRHWEEDEDAVTLWMTGFASGSDDDDDGDDRDEFDETLAIYGRQSANFYQQRVPAPPTERTTVLEREGSRLSIVALEVEINLLSDDDISLGLNLVGGREELRKLLLEGAKARETLMRCNIRLVVSIAKKWMQRSMAASNSEGSRLLSLYSGGWDRPSLDEAIQEGVLGLARAVDKYDATRGLRFSTYSTHWITSYIRQCFQNAATGCLRVPAQLHEIKSTYMSIVKRYMDMSEPFPSEKSIAAEIGVTLSRLRTALRVTEGLISVDQPVYRGSASHKGSGAGGDFFGENKLLISDTLQCSDMPPEVRVEMSFLRQCLENAMAAELSPHERDVLRLRLGLDDGQTRTVREVVEAFGGGISIADIRSAEKRAFKKLRSPNSVHSHNLLAYSEIANIDHDAYQTT